MGYEQVTFQDTGAIRSELTSQDFKDRVVVLNTVIPLDLKNPVLRVWSMDLVFASLVIWFVWIIAGTRNNNFTGKSQVANAKLKLRDSLKDSLKNATIHVEDGEKLAFESNQIKRQQLKRAVRKDPIYQSLHSGRIWHKVNF